VGILQEGPAAPEALLVHQLEVRVVPLKGQEKETLVMLYKEDVLKRPHLVI
jgi:hypothetical protein